MDQDGFFTIQEVLDRSFAMKLVRERSRFALFQEAWKKAVKETYGSPRGDGVAKLTRAYKYQDGKLHVEVFSAPLLMELSSFRKPELLRKLKQEEIFIGIVDLTLKTG